MRLIEFSVTNYRSITTAHKLQLQSLTVLVGKNNEGKSNLLTALNVAMSAVAAHSILQGSTRMRASRIQYDWQRDFPMQFQQRHSGLESIFKLNFRLEGNELSDFHAQTGIRGNEDIPISVKIGKDNRPKVEVPKRGSSSYKRKSREVTEFISKRIFINYIQAVRTESMALGALQNAVWRELRTLRDNPEYVEAQNKVIELEELALNGLSDKLLDPLRTFLPNLKNISIKRNLDDYSPYRANRDFDIVIDDGSATSISNKGDGIKSLLTLAILRDQRRLDGASVIAIEEPESHLHSAAIHSLVDVIHKMSKNNQVIITTHNPLFVQQNKVGANIIVDSGTAKPAKTISEIRNVLGVLPSDNLRNARYILLVEGEDDKIALSKILPAYSNIIGDALRLNQIVIKPLGGAGNLAHDLADLKNCMCKYVVLLDNDQAGNTAADKAKEKGLLRDSEAKFTICNGSPEAEFEDCLNSKVYSEAIKQEFNVDIAVPEFRGKQKWSERIKQAFLSQGSRWTDLIEEKVKLVVANSIPDDLNSTNIGKVVIEKKSGFLLGLTKALEVMIADEDN